MSSPLKGEVTVREPTRAQQASARRAAEAKATIPDITVDAELELDAVTALETGLDPPPALRDFIVKACANALREYPIVNAAYRDGRFELYSRINIGITVAADNAVSVPTILDADTKSIAEIALESRTLAQRVRQGSISQAELAGATFTISDLGMHAISRFQAVIAPSQAAILGLGAPRALPAVEQGRLRERRVLTAAMSCDGRILQGADAAAFLERLGALLAAPGDWAQR